MDEHLDGLSAHVHEVVKRLKMGETGSISVTKQYPAEEIRLYTMAYGEFKKKWFDTKHDKASNAVVCTRIPEPDWRVPDVIDHEEEL